MYNLSLSTIAESTYDYINCTNCDTLTNVKLNAVVSSNCDHRYCQLCTAKIINQSLSKRNEIPKCSKPDCRKTLNVFRSVSKINSLLYTQYRTEQDYYHYDQQRREVSLLRGFVREHTATLQQCHINIHITGIPKEIIALIHDFYNLTYCAQQECTTCDATGILSLVQCRVCHGEGEQSKYVQCQNCVDGTIVHREECQKCDSRGSIITTIHCACTLDDAAEHSLFPPYTDDNNNNGSNDTVCSHCDGLGIVGGGGMRGECAECNGSGKRVCPKCVDGLLSKTLICSHCCGEGCFYTEFACYHCNVGENLVEERVLCSPCDGRGYHQNVECDACDGSAVRRCIDFAQVVQKQSRCHECNQYWPNDYIFAWSACCHTYCKQCFMQLVTKMYANQIPMCSVKDCEQELEDGELRVYSKALSRSFNLDLQSLLSRLELLKYRKNRFDCKLCAEWHLKEQRLTFTKCKHEFGRECCRWYLQSVSIQSSGVLPACTECRQQIDERDIEEVAGKEMVRVLQAMVNRKALLALIQWNRKYTRLSTDDCRKVVKLRRDGQVSQKLDEMVVDLLNGTLSVKHADVQYINIIHGKGKPALFQIRFNTEESARKLVDEVAGKQEEHCNAGWRAGFWHIYAPREQPKKRKLQKQPTAMPLMTPTEKVMTRQNAVHRHHQQAHGYAVYSHSHYRVESQQTWTNAQHVDYRYRRPPRSQQVHHAHLAYSNSTGSALMRGVFVENGGAVHVHATPNNLW